MFRHGPVMKIVTNGPFIARCSTLVTNRQERIEPVPVVSRYEVVL